MKVVLAKQKCQKSKQSIPEFPQPLSISESSSSSRPTGKQKLPNMRKSGASVSTAASEQGDEKLIQEIASLKKELVDKDQEFKIQMSRMKTFYDKHLLELNQLRLNKPKVETKKSPEALKTEEEKKEAELRSLRSKLRDKEAEILKLHEDVKDKEMKVIDLKNRIASQGFTKLSKVIEDLKVEVQTKEEAIKTRDNRIAQIDNLDYQLVSKHPEQGQTIKLLVNLYLKLDSWRKEDSNLLGQRFSEWLLDTWKTSIANDAFSMLHRVWIYLKENFKPVDVESMIHQEIDKWNVKIKADMSQMEKYYKLQEEKEQLAAEVKKYKMMVDAIVSTDGNYRSILCRLE